MVVGIPPREASSRLVVFQVSRSCDLMVLYHDNYDHHQTQFDELWRKFQTYSGGEQLFGLPVTEYQELDKIRKELNLLQKLYGLYNAVMDSVDSYYDILWTNVDTEKINTELLDFQNR